MTKIKLTNGTIINASNVELVSGVLKISTTESTVEELAEIFSNKEKTSLLILMTESGVESGYKKGFTSFAGINYDAEGVKTVELFQPKDVTEARISNAEATANFAKANAESANSTASLANEKATSANEKSSSANKNAANANAKAVELENIITETQLGLAELAEMFIATTGGIE